MLLEKEDEQMNKVISLVVLLATIAVLFGCAKKESSTISVTAPDGKTSSVQIK